MSRLKKEIIETETVIDTCKTKTNQPQRLTDSVLDKIAGSWVDSFMKFEKSW